MEKFILTFFWIAVVSVLEGECRSLHRVHRVKRPSLIQDAYCTGGQYVDTRTDGFYSHFGVTVRSESEAVNGLPYVSNTLAWYRGDDVIVSAAQSNTVFTVEEICIETKGIVGIFWEYEEQAPPPKVGQIGTSLFISAVGGALHHYMTPVVDYHRWGGTCISVSKPLERLIISPVVMDNTNAWIRELTISGCLLPAGDEEGDVFDMN